MEEQNNVDIEPIRRELSKMNVDINELSEKKKKMLIECEGFLKKQHQKNALAIDSIKEKNYSAVAFAEHLGISKRALYKKNSDGDNKYKEALIYLNIRSSYYINKDKRLLTQILRNFNDETDNLKKQIEKLVLRDVDYINLKEQHKIVLKDLKELQKENVKLKAENEELIIKNRVMFN